jgi:hypothetical protein
MTLPESAFSEILQELQTKPLAVNHYRNQAGDGRSQAFGIVNRRCLPPDYSRQNWLRPKLYKHLLDFAATWVDLSFNAVTVNQNYRADKHYDKHNRGHSFLVAFGDYTGGELEIHEGPLKGLHDVRHTPLVADFSTILHSVRPFEGNRYSLVFYNFWTPRLPPLPPATVKEEKGAYFFYRGDQKITTKTGLAHPLRGRKRGHPTLQRQEEEVVVTFP